MPPLGRFFLWPKMTPKAFVEKYGKEALRVEKETGVSSALILAQAAHESNWGKSAPGNNFFGIKGQGPGGTQYLMTTENVNGKNVRVKQSFRKYRTPEESFRDHARLISTSPNYRGVMFAMRSGDINKMAQAIGDSPYATDPQYGQKILSTMSRISEFRDKRGRVIASPTPMYEQFKNALMKPVMAQGNESPTGSPYQTTSQQLGVGTSMPNVYTVKKGDTLWDIAQRELGSGFKWKELGYAGDPRKMQIGTQLNIPKAPTTPMAPTQQFSPVQLNQSWPQSQTPSSQPPAYSAPSAPAQNQSWPQSTPSAPAYSAPRYTPRPAPTPARYSPPAYSPPTMWYNGGTAQGPQRPRPAPVPVPTPSSWY